MQVWQAFTRRIVAQFRHRLQIEIAHEIVPVRRARAILDADGPLRQRERQGSQALTGGGV